MSAAHIMHLLGRVAQVLWRCAGLLLSSLSLCAALEPGCVLGIVGRPVILPCVSSVLLTGNFSIEWRKDDKVVFKTAWETNENLGTWSIEPATIPTNAALTGDFSLELSAVHPRDDRTHFSLCLLSGKNQSVQLCSACLRVAASFSDPLLKRKHTADGDETTFQCHSAGGYPQPELSWLIDNTQEPPEGSVRTQTNTLPDGHLYNITSKLTISLPKDVSVTCIIENLSMNETLRSTYKPNGGPVGRRAAEGMWIFSTALCVVVGLMVIAGVAYQIHLDRLHKRRKQECREEEGGYKRRRRYREETETMTESKETDV